jgi:hypothetical protein
MWRITAIILLAAWLPFGCVSAGEQRAAWAAKATFSAPTTTFCWPLAEFRYSLNRPTGAWLASRGRNSHHLGVDMFAPIGRPVRAIADGVVHDISTSGWGGGNVAIMVKHRLADGRWFIALYGHIRNTFGLRKGSKVQGCSTIGLIGPYRCGSHVHFGVIAPGRLPHAPYGTSKKYNHNNFINPVRFLQTGQPEVPGKDQEPETPIGNDEQAAEAAVSPQCAGQNLAEGSEEEDKLLQDVLAIGEPEEEQVNKVKQVSSTKKSRKPDKAKLTKKTQSKKKKAVARSTKSKRKEVKLIKAQSKRSLSASARKQQPAKHQVGKSKGQKTKQKAQRSSAKGRAARKR